MAWWAATVLGGDEPLDVLDDLLTRLEIHGVWFQATATVQQAVRDFGEARYVQFIEANPPHDLYVCAHIVALVHMVTGVRLSPLLEQLSMQACRHGHLRWAGGELFEQRKNALESYSKLICRFQDGAFDRLRKPHVQRLMGL